jgi:hypothetical protein
MVAGMFLASLTGMALAQTSTAPAAPATPAPAAPATKAPAAKSTDTMKKPMMHSATGTVKSAAPDTLMLVTVGKDKKEKEWSFVLDKDTKLMKAGKAIEAKDIAEKDTATVSYAEADGKMMAKTVTIKTAKAAVKKPATP